MSAPTPRTEAEPVWLWDGYSPKAEQSHDDGQRFKEYMTKLMMRVRYHMARAAEKSAEWEVLNDEVNDYIKREGTTGIVAKARVKEKNLGLMSALDAYGFHQREVLRFSAALQAEKAYWEAMH